MRPLALILLLLCYGLMVSSAVEKSITVDEQGHLFRGVAYVETGATHFLWGHPLLASSLNALPLLTVPDLRLPVDEPAWSDGNWSVAADALLWRLNPNPQRLIFLGRLPTMWLTMMLAALIFRWGRQMGGRKVALFALALFALDPNMLAHGQLITSDLPLSLFLTLTVYAYWRWSENGRLAALVLAGAALGAAGTTKFNAALVLPALGLLALYLAFRRRNWRPLAALLVIGVVAWLTIWLVYRLAWRPLPGGAFWLDLQWQFDYLARPHGAYLAGRYHPTGWWYYFPVAFLLKTPLPTLFLLIWAIIVFVKSNPAGLRRPAGLLEGVLWLPPAVYFAISLVSPLNIGYRHLIPLLPFLYLFTAYTLVRRIPYSVLRIPYLPSNTQYAISNTLLLWLFLETLIAWPNFIPYFNEVTGRQSWRILSDSNVDWGQDLPGLAKWQSQQGRDERLKLSYFGVAHPSAYGVQFDALPTWIPGPEQADPARQAFNPADPAPGLYAISVTNLHGLVLSGQPDTFAWFRDRPPLARIGGSIFIYRVEPTGPPVDVTFAGLRPAELDPTLHARFQSNDIRPRWFNPATSLIWPAGGGWLAVSSEQLAVSSEQVAVSSEQLAVSSEQVADPALAMYWPAEPAAEAEGQLLYRLESAPDISWQGQPAETSPLAFLGYLPLESALGEVVLLTGWRVQEVTERPVKIFVHALDANDSIASQWDGLDVDPFTWQPGDIVIQLHRFAVPAEAGPLHLNVGLYDGETLERLAGPLPIGN